MNNTLIALNISRVNEQKIRHLYKSEFNQTRQRQAVLLMITNDKKHYLAAKRLNDLLKKRQVIVENVV